MNENKNLIKIVSQAFYGNKMGTEIEVEELDRFVLGHLDDFETNEEIDRTIINVPNTNNLVIVYNKYQEEERLQRKEKLLKEDGYELKPLATIPELDLKLYSRCIVCRMNEQGEFESLQKEDYDKFMKYLAN